MRKRRIMLAAFVFCFGIVLLAAIAFPSLKKSLNYPYSELSFNKDLWMKGDEGIRTKMTSDLIHNHLPLGMSIYEITELIGKPNFDKQHLSVSQRESNSFRNYRVLGYNLGSTGDTFLHVDDIYIYLMFNSSKKLVKVELVQH